MKIAHIDTTEKVFIIAEVGNNHEGDFSAACELISKAAEAGADAVKFQTIVPEMLVSSAETARIAQLRKFQFDRAQFVELKRLADEKGILFLSTPFDLGSAGWLNDLVPAFKVASGDNTFWPLLEFLASTGKPLILSTGLLGGEGLAEVQRFISNAWSRNGRPDPGLALLHCIVNYPTEDANAHLSRIRTLAAMPGVTPGYSDHTLGIDAAVLSVGLGARIVEKHFTLDKGRTTFRDHQISADPEDLRAMVAGIRKAEQLLGQPGWDARDSEAAVLPQVRRSLAAARRMAAGETVSAADIIWVRPGSGIPPGREQEVTGRVLAKGLEQGELFTEDHF